MNFGRRFRRLVTRPSRSTADIERDVNDELAFHVDMRVRDLVRLGQAPDAALRQAREEFGNADRLRSILRHEDIVMERNRRFSRWITDLSYDIRFAWRQVARAPLFALVAMLTIAIGIGANTAIMSAVRGILLQPLPLLEPERVVRVYSRTERLGPTAVSVPDYFDFAEQAGVFEGMAASYSTTANLSGDGEPERLQVARVSANWFTLLGIPLVAGRAFATGEDAEGAARRVVMSETLWRTRFGGDGDIIGRSLRLDGEPVEVIGIAPAGRSFPAGQDLWETTRFSAADRAESSRGARWLRVVARLKPGATMAQATADLTRIARTLEERDPKHNTGYTAFTMPLQDSIVGDFRRPLFILLGAVGFLMLIVCANVAGLMLARTAARETEIAVRSAIGAGRGRIARQLVTESLVLSLGGGLAGLALGALGTRLLVSWAPADIPRLENVGLDLGTLGMSLALAIVAGLLFGIAPAMQLSRRDLQPQLKSGARGAAGARGGIRLRRALVVGEVAVAIVLLVGAGLLLKSFARLQVVDPGFRTSGLTAFTLVLPESRYATLASQRQFVDRALDGIGAVPGVEHAAASFGLPLTSTRFQLTFTIDRQPAADPSNEPRGQVRVASPDYFDAMGIPLLKGRMFSSQDRWDAPPVMVVSEELARRFFPDGNAIGRYIDTGWQRDGHSLGGEIVGIVGDVKQFGLSSDAPPAYYAASDQWPTDQITFVVRGGSATASLVPSLRGVIRQLDAELPVYDVTTGEQLVGDALAQPRFYLLLLGAFAGSALLLSVIGVYGVISFTVRQRTREIGVRLALGASTGRILRQVLGEGFVLAIAGIALGSAAALALSGQLKALLFDVGERDWSVFIGVAIVLAVASIAACVIPARSAALLDPKDALQAD